MIPAALEQVARLTGGRLTGDADPAVRVTGPVVIDSRAAAPGALFVCVVGDHADGHDFVPAARAAGAVAALASREVDGPAVVVEDPQIALGLLAAGVLAQARACRVVGVTGSSGKTSTKDLLAQVLEHDGPTVAPENSFNNELGLPLTVLRVDTNTRNLVCEFSARAAGHIRYLAGIARPDVAVVLNIGAAHLGEFGSREAVAAAKAELVEALPDTGVAVLNADDPLALGMRSRTTGRVVTFGTTRQADVRVVDLTLDSAARASFRLVTDAGSVAVSLLVHGAPQALNAAAAAAAAMAVDVDLATVGVALSTATARSRHRMEVHRRSDGLIVIDDAYNANPESSRAALDALAVLGVGRRRWAVLGEMRELGAESELLHRDVGHHAAASGVDEIVVVGPAAPVADGAATVPGWAGRARAVADPSEAAALLAREVRAGDTVLVKASNTVRLWEVAEALLADETVPVGAGKVVRP